MASSKRMVFALGNDICNALAPWTSDVMVSMLVSYVNGFMFVCVK